MHQQVQIAIASMPGSHVDVSNLEHTIPAAMVYRLCLCIYY